MKVSEIIKESDEKSVKVIQASIEGFSRQGMSYGAIREMLISMAPEKLVDALIQEHKNENDNETIEVSILKSEKYKDKATWYKKIEGDDSRWSRLKNYLSSLKKPWEPDHIADLDIQSDLVVKNLAPPNGEPRIYKGMVLGYVQSGKTANFSASIAKAIDQGYRIIIVLGGMYNNLRSQTQRRLETELVNTFDRDKTICLTDTTNTGDFKEPTGITAGNLLSSKPVFCVIKKNVSPMKRFLKWFKNVNLEKLKKYPVLIIDDEADQASVNNNDPEQDRTAINQLLTEIMSFFGENTVTNYVGYTATPFANIFIDAQDREDIFPEDFFISLRPPAAYNGTLKLFGRASIDGDDAIDGIDVFRDIEAHEIDDLKNLSSLTKLPDSLRYAIDSYYLACAERIIRSQKKDDMTMLVHTSHLKDDHKKMCRLINKYIEYSKNEFKAGTSYLGTLEKIWEEDFIKTTRDSFGETKVSPFSKIKDALEIFFIDFLPEAIRENSDSKTRLDFTGDEPVHAIVVGGNTLSRGLTIEGLTVSYFQRNSKGYDTLLQMGRWFGYRKNYLDLTRIFVTPVMHEIFYFLATVEEEIREDIDQMALNGERPRDVSIKVREHDKLQITGRQTLKNNSVFSARTYSGSKIQARYVIPGNKLIAENNHQLVEGLVKDLEASDCKSNNLYSVHENTLLFRNVDSEKVISFLEDVHLSKDDKKMSVKLLGPYIQKLNQRSELNDWSVAIMSRKNGDDLRKVKLGNSFVYSLNRSYAPRLFSQDDYLKHPLNTLMGYRDELIDMKDVMGDDFVKVLESRVDSISYKQVRKKRPNERGLLIIYPIYTNHNLPKDELNKLISDKKTLIYSKSEVLYTIAMIFPFSQVPEMTFSYRENFTVKK